MIALFLDRIFRSVKIEPEVFNEVQKDKNATLSAAIVVLLSSASAGIGAAHLGLGNFILAPLFSLLSWFVWAYIVYFVGVKLFPDIKTKTTQFALMRAIGFSSAPGIIRIFGFNEELMTVTFIGSAFWMLACMVVAVKETLNYKSLWKALGVVIISWFVQAFALISILSITRNF
mgnify:FL=1|jgi:hypothetical protein|tara:strand:+ start:252 stop:773 length:522 start_codon:yes stop_codon:yes gene_type:complete